MQNFLQQVFQGLQPLLEAHEVPDEVVLLAGEGEVGPDDRQFRQYAGNNATTQLVESSECKNRLVYL